MPDLLLDVACVYLPIYGQEPLRPDGRDGVEEQAGRAEGAGDLREPEDDDYPVLTGRLDDAVGRRARNRFRLLVVVGELGRVVGAGSVRISL